MTLSEPEDLNLSKFPFVVDVLFAYIAEDVNDEVEFSTIKPF